MFEYTLILYCSVNVLFVNSLLAENNSVPLTPAEIENEPEKPSQSTILKGYFYEKPVTPFEYPTEKMESFISIPTPPEVDLNFQHQDLGSLHKASRQRGVVKRIKLRGSNSNSIRHMCKDVTIADYLKERRRKRPLNRRLAPYTEVFRDRKYFEEETI